MLLDTWYKDYFVRNAEKPILEKKKKVDSVWVETHGVMVEESHLKIT